MLRMPRAGVGSIDVATDYRPLVWALLDVLESCGIQSQLFLSQAHFSPHDVATAVTGRGYRHLDSWLMSNEFCREVFAHGMQGADFAIVEGRFESFAGGSLDKLCEYLDLPRWGVLDVSKRDFCRQMMRPEQVDGVFLDGLAGRGELLQMQTQLEALWGVPVLGGLIRCPHVRAIIDRLPDGARPSAELCHALSDSLILTRNAEHLIAIAGRREMKEPPNQLFVSAQQMSGLNVAVAYDEAFSCYFPDTLDLLELAGANVCDFSPLRDETLPADTDIVYLGCGHPQRLAEALAGNHCMLLALRGHACAGKPIYAEGGGLAYLANQMQLPDGRCYPMCGVLPIVARYRSRPAPPEPVQVTLAQDCWLGESGCKLRGYLSNRWQIRPLREVTRLAKQRQHACDLISQGQVIGSRLHLSLVAQPHLVSRFLSAPASVAAAG